MKAKFEKFSTKSVKYEYNETKKQITIKGYYILDGTVSAGKAHEILCFDKLLKKITHKVPKSGKREILQIRIKDMGGEIGKTMREQVEVLGW